jgi:hypothetical protein
MTVTDRLQAETRKRLAAARKTAALNGAWDWVGQYEAEDPDSGQYSITLDTAFELAKTPGEVKRRYPDFPADLVDAYAILRRMVNARR